MTNSPARIVACPTCGKSVQWTESSRFRPFCSDRCRLIDLGAWASESYRIADDKRDGNPETGGSED